MTEWQYDSPGLDTADDIYRKILDDPSNGATWDPEDRCWKIHPGAFRRCAYQGASVHVHSILIERKRNPDTIYPTRYGYVALRVGVPRQHDLGVLLIPDPDEHDEVLRAAHAEIRPPSPEKSRRTWKEKINEICLQCRWMRMPQSAT